jgi:tRNA threonylcarbamoyladenosine biosynthesis protein TsaB
VLLAIDTSTDDSGVALYDQHGVLAESTWRSGRRHAEQIMPMVDLLMQNLRAAPSDLVAVAVATGPGSWSGLRVGMSLAKAVAFARSLPIVGVPTLDVLAYNFRHRGVLVTPLVRLGRDRYGGAVYTNSPDWRRTNPFQNLSLEELPSLIEGGIVCGDVDQAAHDLLQARLGTAVTFATGADNVRRPAALAELAWQRLLSGTVDDLITLEPIYLGSPVKER